jgi:ATP-dependent Lon protease
MKESSQIAQTYAKNFLHNNYPNNPDIKDYLDTHNLHIHFPEGAVKKDGPSAGMAITTSLISLALGKSIP